MDKVSAFSSKVCVHELHACGDTHTFTDKHTNTHTHTQSCTCAHTPSLIP